MILKLLFGIAITWTVVTQAFDQIYIDPTLAHAGTLACNATCTELAPCGIPSLLLATPHCDINIGNGNWPAPLDIQTTGVDDTINVYHWDSTGTGDYIRNLTLEFMGDVDTSLYMYFWNATGTTLNITSRLIQIFGSTFIMDDVEPFNFVGAGENPYFYIMVTSLFKNSGTPYAMSLESSNTTDIVIMSSTITMPGIGIFSGSVSGITVRDSFLNASSLISEAFTNVWIFDSHLVGFEESLANSPPKNFTSASSMLIGSEAQVLPLFRTNSTMESFRALDSNFTWVEFINPPQTVSSIVAHSNTFNGFRASFNLVAPNSSLPFQFDNNTFLRYTADYPVLELVSSLPLQKVPIFLSGNQFQNLFAGIIRNTCSVSLGDFIVNNASDLVTDGLCVSDTHFDGSLNASFVEAATVESYGLLSTTGNVTLSSFRSESSVTLSFLNGTRLHYSVTNASQGIAAFSIRQMPQYLDLSWEDPTHSLNDGDTWPLFLNLHFLSPTTFLSSGFCLNAICWAPQGTFCTVNFTILSSPTGCDLNSSSPPTSNPTSNPISQSCPTPQPSPEFQCQHGTWSSNTSITQDTLNIPSNSGTIVVDGNLTITQTVIFQGLGSLINVTGCIFVDGDVVVELTDHDIEEIRKGSKTFILMSSVDGNDCESSNDLSLIPINVKTPDKCVKVDAVNSGTKQTLAATFTINQSKCSSSHLVAILVPSIVGGVVILSAVAIIVFLKIRHDKMHR